MPPSLRIYYDLETNQYRDTRGNTFKSVNGVPPKGGEDFWDEVPPDNRPVFAVVWEGEDHADLLVRAGQWLDEHYPKTVLDAERWGIKPYPNRARECFEAAIKLNPELHPFNPVRKQLSLKPLHAAADESRQPTRIYYQAESHQYLDKDGASVDVVNCVPPTNDEAQSDEELDRRPVFRFTWEGEDHIDILLRAADWLATYYPAKALACFEAAARLAPEFYPSYSQAGRFLIRQKRFPEAIPYFQKWIEVEPESALAYQSMGLLYSKLEDLENAISFIDKAIQHQPQNLAACLLKLRWLVELKRWAEINDFYEQHEMLVQEANEARLTRCLALAQEGRTEEARAAFEATPLKSKRRFRALTMEIADLLGLARRKW